MRIDGIRTLGGPNIYSYHPVPVMKLFLDELAETPSNALAGFVDRLLETVPGLDEHYCSEGHRGGFVERLRDGTWMGHIVEHVALELSDRAGIPVTFGKTRSSGDSTAYHVAVEFKNEAGMRSLLETAAGLVESLIYARPYPLSDRLQEARQLVEDTELGPSTRAIVDAAERRNIPWIRLSDENLIQFGYGCQRQRIMAAMSDATSVVASDIAADKHMTKALLDRAAIPVPRGLVVWTEEEAVAAWQNMAAPVVIKPLDGCQGAGVSLDINSSEQLSQAFALARQFSKSVIVEELLVGKNYRVLVIDGKIVATSERLPARVVGDGVHTIAELVEIENRDPRRGRGHDKALTFIEFDPIAFAHLEKVGLSKESVPNRGEPVLLRESANLSTGGTAVDVTDQVHPSIVSMCERAARVIGLDICGIDLVAEDITRPMGDSEGLRNRGGIIEINASPGLRMHVLPSEGTPRPVGDAIVNMLFPEGTSGRIPIVAITGTNGKTTVTRMLEYIMSGTGKITGVTRTDGVYIGGKAITRGDHTGPRSASIVLSDPAVEVAVLETARGGIMRSGLGYDWSDVGVITNIQIDHIGQDGITGIDDLIFVKSLVAERVREGGTLVLNAEDENVLRMFRDKRVQKVKRNIVFFGLSGGHPQVREHRAAGGTVYFQDGGWIIEGRGHTEQRIVQVAQVPTTCGGFALFNIANALAATAACRAFGIAPECIARSLVSFVGGEHNPGRANFYRLGAARIMLDYGHNPHALEAVARMAALQGHRRTTAVLAIPGDRADWVIEESGRIAASGFDRIIIREDRDLRGRKPGETACLVERVIRSAKAGCDCRIVLDEEEAFTQALTQAQDGELVVLFYDEFDRAEQALKRAGAEPAAVTAGTVAGRREYAMSC